MSAPTVKYWKVTGISGADAITLLNTSGGPVATQLTSSPFDLGDIEAGMWAVPAVMLIEFSGNTAQAIDFKMYDTDSNVDSPIITTLGDDIFASYTNSYPGWSACYNIHMDLKKNWTDPTAIGVSPGSSPIDSWPAVLYGGSPTRLDTYKPAPGNDSTNNLLTASLPTSGSTDTSRHATNFYLYISIKPKSSAAAGEHLGFGHRISYIYP